MTPDYRAMCAELLQELCCFYKPWDLKEERYSDAMKRARALLTEPVAEGPSADELIGLALRSEPWATWLRSGGCLESAHCELADLMLAVLALWGRPAAEPVPETEAEGPSADEWDALVKRAWDEYETVGYQGERFVYDSDFCNALDFVRRELARWGRPAAAPVPEPGERPRELQWPASVAQGCHEAAAEAESGSPLQQLLVAAGDLLERGRPAAAPAPETGEARELVEWLTMLRDHDLRHDAAYAHPAIADHWNNFLTRAATLLQQQAAPSPAPVPVSERLPGPEDCDAEGRCWLGGHQMGSGTPTWLLGYPAWAERFPDVHRFWLPAHALPLPPYEGGEVS